MHDILEQGRILNLYSSAILWFSVNNRETIVSLNEETVHTRYDLASLTKVCGTLPAILTLIERQELTPDTRIDQIYPELTTELVGKITIARLLTHTSGLPSYQRFYEGNEMEPFEAIRKVRPINPIGTDVIYSDLNFIWLGLIVEKIVGVHLADYLSANIFSPLGMKMTSYDATGAMATRTINQPDDHNAAFFSRPVGHAGLFSNIEDLSLYLNYVCETKRPQWREATLNQTRNLKVSRGWGWELWSPSVFFNSFSMGGFGHTGYTGTSLAVDPMNKIKIILLTNRTFCGTDRRFLDFRREIHRYIFEKLTKSNCREG